MKTFFKGRYFTIIGTLVIGAMIGWTINSLTHQEITTSTH